MSTIKLTRLKLGCIVDRPSTCAIPLIIIISVVCLFTQQMQPNHHSGLVEASSPVNSRTRQRHKRNQIITDAKATSSDQGSRTAVVVVESANEQQQQQQQQQQVIETMNWYQTLIPRHENKSPGRMRRSSWPQAQHYATALAGSETIGPLAAAALINELRISGSKNEPPSRPSVDWSRQRPYFGSDMQRNVSVELGKTAYLTCKVFELGDKTVSWLRPRENEILTSGRFTYISDLRFTSINNNGSQDWTLEIKDVGLNDSTSYECQVSTDPKMSAIINLHVKAAKSRIKQGEQYYASMGANIEFTCEIVQATGVQRTTPQTLPNQHHHQSPSSASNSVQQIYWYHNGNLINYAKTSGLHNLSRMNFSLDLDQQRQTSRLKLFNIQPNEAGNYTCKPTSAEPSTIRLRVKRPMKNHDRVEYGNSINGNGGHSAGSGVALRNRQQYGYDPMESTNNATAACYHKNNWIISIIIAIAALQSIRFGLF